MALDPNEVTTETTELVERLLRRINPLLRRRGYHSPDEDDEIILALIASLQEIIDLLLKYKPLPGKRLMNINVDKIQNKHEHW